MSKTLESLTKFVDGYSSITVSAKQIASVNREVDARIAELTDEVASLRGHCAALIGWLKTLDTKGFVDHHQDAEDARNALKEGCDEYRT